VTPGGFDGGFAAVNPWAWQNNSAISSKKGFEDSGQFGNNLATTLAMSAQCDSNAGGRKVVT
jgi:hypothetical protein